MSGRLCACRSPNALTRHTPWHGLSSPAVPTPLPPARAPPRSRPAGRPVLRPSATTGPPSAQGPLPSQPPSQAPRGPAAVSWSHTQAPLYGLCAGGAGTSGSAPPPPPAADHFQPGTATPGGPLAALLPPSGLRLSRLGGLGQSQCEWSSERRPVAAILLHGLRGLFPRDPRHAVPWQTRRAREAGVGGGRVGGRLGHPRRRPGVRSRSQHRACMVGRGGGPSQGLFTVFPP